MSLKRRRDSFDQLVADLIDALTDAARLAEAADRQADREEGIRSAAAGAKSLLRRWRQPRPTLAAEAEFRIFGDALLDLYRELEYEARTDLKRDVRWLGTRLPEKTERRREVLAEPVRSRYAMFKMDARQAGDSLRDYVHQGLERIIPPGAVPATGGIMGDEVPPHGSLLTPGAHAFAWDHSVKEFIIDVSNDRPNAWWKVRMHRGGLEDMMPAVTEQTNGDSLEALRLINRFLGGVLLGTRLDENTLDKRQTKLMGPVVVDPTLSTLVIGAPNTGKTTSVIGPYAVQRAALGDNVIVVTPQPATIRHIMSTVTALSGQERPLVFDLAGEIVGPESPEFYAWDVTRNCLTIEGVRDFADGFAGRKVEARAELNNPLYWGGMVWDMYAAAGHIAAWMRELYGLNPDGVNGMECVHNLLEGTGGVPNGIPETSRAALAGSPAKLRDLEVLFQEAIDKSELVNPRLRRIAFQEHILRVLGAPLNDDIVGKKLKSLSVMLNQVGQRKDGDPMESLISSFMRCVPPAELRVMSPRDGDREISPTDLVRPGAGVSFITYSQTRSTGLTPGLFTQWVLDELARENTERSMLRDMGITDPLTRFAIVVDEGSAAEHIPGLVKAVTNMRQLGGSVCLAMTSVPHLRSVFGEEDAGKFLHAPCVIDLSPDAQTSTATAPLFGQRTVDREGHTGRHETKEDTVNASNVHRLMPGEALVTYQSDPAGDRVKFVQLAQIEDPSTVVGAAVAYVDQHPEWFEPWSGWLKRSRPDLDEKVKWLTNPAAALGAAALAGPDKESAVVAEVVSEPVSAVESAVQPAEVEVTVEPVPEPEREASAQPAVDEVALEPEREVSAQPAVDEVALEPEREASALPAEVEVAPEPEPDVPARVAVDDVAPEPEREVPVRPAEVEVVPESEPEVSVRLAEVEVVPESEVPARADEGAVVPESEVPARADEGAVVPESEVSVPPVVVEVVSEPESEVSVQPSEMEVAPEPEALAPVEVLSVDDLHSRHESTVEVAPEPVHEAPAQPAADEFPEAEVEENPNKI